MRRPSLRKARATLAKSPLDRVPLDIVDLISGPVFIATMLWEAKALRDRPQREMGDLDGWTKAELADPSLPGDELIPVGYEKRDTAASLAMLVGNVTVTALYSQAYGRIARRLYGRRVANFGTRPIAGWITAMVMWDFLYYWSHRWQHESRILWANHVTHHSSEHYNLSTALRQPWQGYLTAWVFLPMPLLGVPLHRTARAGQLNLLYQYWIHTEAIDRLDPTSEAILNTPSHHRVHHGANPQYLDKNYAGILIVWDKLFGTFEPEVRRVKYGLTKNIKTFNPVRIGYHETADIVRDAVKAKGWRNKLGHIFRGPGWQPDAAPAAEVYDVDVKASA